MINPVLEKLREAARQTKKRGLPFPNQIEVHSFAASEAGATVRIDLVGTSPLAERQVRDALSQMREGSGQKIVVTEIGFASPNSPRLSLTLRGPADLTETVVKQAVAAAKETFEREHRIRLAYVEALKTQPQQPPAATRTPASAPRAVVARPTEKPLPPQTPPDAADARQTSETQRPREPEKQTPQTRDAQQPSQFVDLVVKLITTSIDPEKGELCSVPPQELHKRVADKLYWMGVTENEARAAAEHPAFSQKPELQQALKRAAEEIKRLREAAKK